MQTKIKIGQLLIILFFTSCTYEFPMVESPAIEDLGDINTENIIAVGDGFLAGAMDGALYSAGQQNSVASVFASQLSRSNEISFNQPKINAKNGFNFYASKGNQLYGKWIYRFQNQTDEKPKMILTAGELVEDYQGDKTVLNNLAVPMLSVTQLLNYPDKTNPYVFRVFSDATQNISQQIIDKSTTLVLCWIGMNDYLKYAMNGAVELSNLTSVETFRNNISLLMNELIQKSDSKILLGNLISIENLPYFYFKTFDNLFLEGQKLGAARARYKQFNLAVSEFNRTVPEEQQRPYIDFYDNGSNPHSQPLVVVDNTLPDASYPDGSVLEKFRQLDKNEMVLHSVTDDMLENGFGWLTPMEEQYYLTVSETELIINRISAFNSVIEEIAANFPQQIALVDINSKIAEVAETGKTDAWGDPLSNNVIYFEGVPVGGSLYLNSIFSLDGIHFNQRGNAFVTNIFIQALNGKFGAKVKTVNINDYPGNAYSPPI
jgi:hypothetical protein